MQRPAIAPLCQFGICSSRIGQSTVSAQMIECPIDRITCVDTVQMGLHEPHRSQAAIAQALALFNQAERQHIRRDRCHDRSGIESGYAPAHPQRELVDAVGLAAAQHQPMAGQAVVKGRAVCQIGWIARHHGLLPAHLNCQR